MLSLNATIDLLVFLGENLAEIQRDLGGPMPNDLFDTMRKLTGGRRPYRDIADVLRTRVWIEALFRTHKVSRHEVSKVIAQRGSEPSGNVLRWLKGTHSARPHSVKLLARAFPGSDEIYELPLFDLLRNKPIASSTLRKLGGPYIAGSPLQFWAFPGNNKPSTILLQDSEGLVERGDIYGLMGVLYLARLAENENDALSHLKYIQDCWRAFPAAARDPAFFRRWQELLQCLYSVHGRMLTTLMLVRPDEDVIRNQIYAKQHLIRRTSRPRDPSTGAFVEIDLPYEMASFRQ